MVDFGARGVELAYTLLDGYETLVLVAINVALLVLQIPDIKRAIRLWTM